MTATEYVEHTTEVHILEQQNVDDYVNLYHIDTVISDAVNTILRTQPKDPFCALTTEFAQHAQTPLMLWGHFSCDTTAVSNGEAGEDEKPDAQMRTRVVPVISIYGHSVAGDAFEVNCAVNLSDCLTGRPVTDILSMNRALSTCSDANAMIEIQWHLLRFAAEVRDESPISFPQYCLRRHGIRHSDIGANPDANDIYSWRKSGFPVLTQKLLLAGGPSPVAEGVAVGLALSLWTAPFGPQAEDLVPVPNHPLGETVDSWAPHPNCMEITLLHFAKIHEHLRTKVGGLAVDGVNYLSDIAEGVKLVYDAVKELFPTLPETECPGNGDWFEVIVFCASADKDGDYPVNTDGSTETIDAALARYQELCGDRTNLVLISPFSLDNGTSAYASLHKSHPCLCVMADAKALQATGPPGESKSTVVTLEEGPSAFLNRYRWLCENQSTPEMIVFDDRTLMFSETALGLALALPRSLRFFLIPRNGAETLAIEYTRLLTVATRVEMDDTSNLPDSLSLPQMKRGLMLRDMKDDTLDCGSLFRFLDLEGKGTVTHEDFQYVTAHGGPATIEEIYTFCKWVAHERPRIHQDGAAQVLMEELASEIEMCSPDVWQRLVFAVGINVPLSEDRIRAIFVSLDTNRSGYLSREEVDGLPLLAALHTFHEIERVRDCLLRKYKDLKQAMRHLDTNHTGCLSFENFADGLRRLDVDISTEGAYLVFQFMDLDASGAIAQKEFEWFLEFHPSSFLQMLCDFRVFVGARIGSARKLFAFFAGEDHTCSRSCFLSRFPMLGYFGAMEAKVLFSFLDTENNGILKLKQFVYLDVFQTKQACDVTRIPQTNAVTNCIVSLTHTFGSFDKVFPAIVEALEASAEKEE